MKEQMQMHFNENVMKIIPKRDKISADNSELFDILNATPSRGVKIYQKFMSVYGGGLVFPNTFTLPDSLIERSEFKTMAAQSILDAERVIKEREREIDGVSNSKDFLVIARTDTVAHFHLSLQDTDSGAIYYWEPFGDGVTFIHEKIAQDFLLFLDMLYFDPDQGVTLPWRNMKSVDDAPAEDFDPALLT